MHPSFYIWLGAVMVLNPWVPVMLGPVVYTEMWRLYLQEKKNDS